MRHPIPTVSGVRAELMERGHGELQALSKSTGVPFTTLWNIRNGITQNPGIETVRQFYDQLLKLPKKATVAAEAR